MKFVKIASVILAVLMAVSLAGCRNGPDWVAKYNGKTYNSGVYLEYLMSRYVEASSGLGYIMGSKLLKSEKDGMKVSEWITSKAQYDFSRHLAVNKLFEEYGLELTEYEISELNSGLENEWLTYGSKLYEPNGISKQSLREASEVSLKFDKIFEYLYGVGGINEVPESELKEYFKGNYYRTIYFTISLEGTTDKPLTDEEKEKKRETARKYYEMAASGTPMEDVLYDYRKESYVEQGLDPNEVVKSEKDDIAFFVKKDSTNYPEEFRNALAEMNVGDVKMVELEKYILIAKKYDVLEDESKFDDYRPTLLKDIKGEEFNALIDSEAAAIMPEYNPAALKAYKPEVIDIKALFGQV